MLKAGITTRMMTRMALLIALNVVLERILSLRIILGGVEGLRIGIGPLPVVFAGVFMGPLAGGLVGAIIGDLVGFLINPLGPYMPHFTLTATLRGVIPGLLIFLFSRGRREVGIFPLFTAVAAMFVCVNILLQPYFVEILFGTLRVVTVPAKIAEAAVSIPAYTAFFFALGRIMQRVLPLGLESDQPILHISTCIW